MRASKVVLTASVVAFASVGLYAQASSSSSATPPLSPARQGVAIARQGVADAPKIYGTQDTGYVEVPATQFRMLDSTKSYFTTGFGWMSPVGLYQTGGSQENFAAGITSVLPAGALLTRLELDSCDTNAGGNNVHGWLTVCDYNGQACAAYQVIASSNGDGCTSYSFDISPLNLIVDNFNNSYTLQANVDAMDGTNIINGMILGYKLQVSAAPGAAAFGDVPLGHPFFQYIEALYASGITGGCGGGNYCPDNPVTRGQMAVFLSKALGLYHQY